MPLEVARTRKLLADLNFKQLFIEELGWNRHNACLQIPIDGHSFSLTAVAEKCGMAAFLCGPEAGGRIPEYSFRRKIERQVAKTAHEHLIVFVDGNQTAQIWQWVRREQGRPAACREHTYHKGQPGDSLIQKLQALAVSLDEEESLTLPDVTGRARRAFDVERVTKKFYDRFKTEHATFLEFLDGIPDEGLERWYVSLMLNRLMFIYFVQKKGFLSNDPDYLKNKLAQCRRELGKDHYYRDFLCPLFFEGFAKQKDDRPEEMKRLLGEVPYLNGGIFTQHQVEQLHGEAIAIPDEAFDKLFEFFDAYHWHLDERPLRQDNEINPDVLGYIFEKYINQKQMGAYYTKEDITEYISKNTVVPFLFDATQEKCKVAFEGDRCVWRLLQEDPDRYVYPAVRHGAGLPLPAEIADGLDTSKPNLIERRKVWNKTAPAEYALPTEIWREVVARRKRYEEVHARLSAGEVRSINDLITCNLDIRQFAQDVIENAEGPELLVAFWKAIEAVTVLDPACGSGAFLFAALNILEPLYEACLERMRFFLEEWGENGRKNHPNYYKLFTDTLKRVEGHPNYRYFVLKSIIVSNLYGVDIMEEAVEICRLRLFLKLVAQVEKDDRKDNMGLEPLPDIDFNIRAGNTLVGFASLDEVRKAFSGGTQPQGAIQFGEDIEALKRFEVKLADSQQVFDAFRSKQLEGAGIIPAHHKQELTRRLGELRKELDLLLATDYGINASKIPDREKREGHFLRWRRSHQPFHWFSEFYGILRAGGFDIVIGNPPYVEYKDVKDTYTVKGFSTLSCADLYAFCVERAIHLLTTKGYLGMIVPISMFGTDGFSPLQQLTIKALDPVWVSFFANRPSQLFDGAQKRLTIVLGRRFQTHTPTIYTTRYNRWLKEEFGHLFRGRMEYASPHPVFSIFPASLEKIGSTLEASAFRRITSCRYTLLDAITEKSEHRLYYTRKFGYFLAFLDFIPRMIEIKGGRPVLPSELKDLSFDSGESAQIAIAALSSSTFFWFWNVLSDCRNLNRRDLLAFPVHPPHLATEVGHKLTSLSRRYLETLKKTSRFMSKSGLKIETFEYATSKPIIDEIDCVLAKHYGFTDEELDFIINYDIKYRMGDEISGEDDE
jgi:hypothetical protein